MTSSEKIVQKRIRNTRIQKAVLTTLLISGGVLMGAAPSPSLLFKAMRSKGKNNFREDSVRRSIKRLHEAGYIEFRKTNRGVRLRITEEGKKQLEMLEARHYEIKKPKRWDKKWRMVIFDVKEHKRYQRDMLRETLQAIGFIKLQQSVWLYPYPCEGLITLLKADFRIGHEVLYIIADTIENDRALKNNFGLK